jgi:peptide/nickel transport system permease protein
VYTSSTKSKRQRRTFGGLAPETALQWVGLVGLVLWAMVAVFAPLLAPHDPVATGIGPLLSPPDSNHWLGTDQLGRDILSRLIYGSRVTLPLGIITVAIALAVGIPWGTISGYFGGRTDQWLMRVADLVLAFPSLVLALAIAGAMGAGPAAAVVGVSVALTPRYARMVRGEVLSIREREYVMADVSFGARPSNTLLRVVVPNAIRPATSVAILDLGTATVAAATLSFLGLGVRPPFPEWGAMTSIGLAYPGQWWLSIPSGLCLVSFIMAINLYANRSGGTTRSWRRLR